MDIMKKANASQKNANVALTFMFALVEKSLAKSTSYDNSCIFLTSVWNNQISCGLYSHTECIFCPTYYSLSMDFTCSNRLFSVRESSIDNRKFLSLIGSSEYNGDIVSISLKNSWLSKYCLIGDKIC